MATKTDVDVVQAILQRFNRFGKRGKPTQKGEWTHLAAFAAVWPATGEIKVLCYATGTKCLGASAVDDCGYSVNDCHAEILARRALIRYFMQEAVLVLNDKKKSKYLFEKPNAEKLAVSEDWNLVFFASGGDASIIPKDIAEDADRVSPEPKRLKLNHDQEPQTSDCYRTGAKCIVGGPQDQHLPGLGYHSIGAFRTKPGRGERTLSMSCSDKLTKWCIMGVQGSLLTHVISRPIYINTFVIGGTCPYSTATLQRALIERNEQFKSESEDYYLHAPRFVYIDQIEYPFRETLVAIANQQTFPSSLCCLWHDGMEQPEVLVDGFKQGNTAKTRFKPQARSVVCRWSQVSKLRRLWHKVLERSNTVQTASLSYQDMKLSAESYSNTWRKLKEFYQHWIDDVRKSSVQRFLVNNDT